ncbi:MAG: quinol:electron acceptor oxidoreductase subunit ActD [Acidobacteriota bacterium]
MSGPTSAAGRGTVYGLFAAPAEVQRAVDGLRALGLKEREIVVMSAEPFEEYEFSHRDSATWLHWIAGIGGVVGLSAAIALLVTTQQAWPIVTSGMPIVAWWPNLIIMFELTMLGAILFTVVTLLFTVVMPRQRSTFYDPVVSDGHIVVGVENAADRIRVVEVLSAAGGRPPAAGW